jgi:type II secretory pathway component PulF
MKAEELAFVNQQLAEMLRSGIPLEGALRQLCAEMHRGDLRRELELLTADLANGIPLTQALAARKLPTFYMQMLRVGAKSGDLPGVLTLVADYYQRANVITTRLQGLMIYPCIVVFAMFALSVWFAILFEGAAGRHFEDLFGRSGSLTWVYLWTAPAFLAILSVAVVVAMVTPALRRWLRWRLPAAHEANLAQVAGALAVMLRGGCTLAEGIDLLQEMEASTPAGRELAQWRTRLANGASKFADIAGSGKTFPALFVWSVANAGEDLARGFRQAADIYRARAVHRTDTMLYAALPVAILVLGGLVVTQIVPVYGSLVQALSGLGSD